MDEQADLSLKLNITLTGDPLGQAARYVIDRTRLAIEAFGPRPPGSTGETRLQEHLRDELTPFCDAPAVLEPFPVAARAFMATPACTGLLLLFSILLYGYSHGWALAASLAAVVILGLEVGLYRRFLDPLFPRETSHNVFGLQKPREEVRRRLLLVGHADAAFEWRWHYRFPGLFPHLMGYTMGGLAVAFLLQFFVCVAELHGPLPPSVAIGLAVLQWVCLPAALLGIGFTSFGNVSPGANDNLSGAFLVAALARYLHQSGNRPRHTEIVYVVTGSEEAGLRGAKRLVETRREQWRDVPTVAVVLDTLRDLEHLHVYSRDMNGLVRHDADVCRWLLESGRRCGYELGEASVYLGSTDATAFTQGGVPAAALCAMDPRPAHYYHNRRDNADNMSPECLRVAMRVLLEAIDRYDRQGLAEGGGDET